MLATLGTSCLFRVAHRQMNFGWSNLKQRFQRLSEGLTLGTLFTCQTLRKPFIQPSSERNMSTERNHPPLLTFSTWHKKLPNFSWSRAPAAYHPKRYKMYNICRKKILQLEISLSKKAPTTRNLFDPDGNSSIHFLVGGFNSFEKY